MPFLAHAFSISTSLYRRMKKSKTEVTLVLYSIRNSYCTATVPLTGMPPIVPVIVNYVIPVGTVMERVVEEVVFAIVALDGTTPLGLLDRETVLS
jgi:hypothetical protein